MAYLPHRDEDRRAMLDAIGLRSADELFAAVPAHLRNPPMDLPAPLGEQELVAELERLADRNRPLRALHSFLGAGVYHRFSPAIVRGTVSRPEFYTAYTPYQAEASQGTLQTIFEFQTMICELTGLDVANASLYDGATAAAEGLLLGVAHTGRDRVVVCGTVHPEAIAVMQTYAAGRGVHIDVVPQRDGVVDVEALRSTVTPQHAAVLVAQPTFFGCVDDLAPLAEITHAAGALLVASVDPIACTVLVAPGDAGADVAVGDGQPLGLPASFGGPHVGFMAVRQSLMRRIPGRLVGMTTDHAGRRAYTLTLQTREQHIRREHATSNICTNHALMALAATVYMAHMGAGGMRAVADVSARRAHHLATRLAELPGFALANAGRPFLWEFTLRTPLPAVDLVRTLAGQGIAAGFALSRAGGPDDELLVCCTELTAPAAIDAYVDAARALARVPAEATA